MGYLARRIKDLWSKTSRTIGSKGAIDSHRKSYEQSFVPCSNLPRNRSAIPDVENVQPDGICEEVLASHAPISFQCNICGKENVAPIDLVSNREAASCSHCQSSLRMRSLIYVLAVELFGKAFVLPEFPESKEIVGAGMSDWDGYAIPLSQKLGYTNTYYHKEPKLDIRQINERQQNKYDFIISSDVFEHIQHPVSIAFSNTSRLLKPGGLFLFTVPYEKHGFTREYYPDLFDFRFEQRDEQTVVINTTVDGETQIFTDPVFHGGDGFTLEMRMFTEQSLIKELEDCNFTSIRIHNQHFPPYGIIWPMDWALPITARKEVLGCNRRAVNLL